jgi:hypothetical protein
MYKTMEQMNMAPITMEKYQDLENLFNKVQSFESYKQLSETNKENFIKEIKKLTPEHLIVYLLWFQNEKCKKKITDEEISQKYSNWNSIIEKAKDLGSYKQLSETDKKKFLKEINELPVIEHNLIFLTWFLKAHWKSDIRWSLFAYTIFIVSLGGIGVTIYLQYFNNIDKMTKKALTKTGKEVIQDFRQEMNKDRMDSLQKQIDDLKALQGHKLNV